MRPILVVLTLASWLAFQTACPAVMTDPELRKILENYVEQCGGKYKLQDLTSLRWEGNLLEDGTPVAEVIVMRKRPQKIRLTMEQGPRKITMGCNGKNCWLREDNHGRQVEDAKLSKESETNLRRELDLIDPLVEYRLSNYTYTLLDEQSLDGTDCYVIEVTRPRVSGRELYFLAKDSLKLLQHNVETTKPDGSTETTVNVYSDFRPVNGVSLPYTVTTMLPNGRCQVLHWDTITPNHGIFDYYFEPPK